MRCEQITDENGNCISGFEQPYNEIISEKNLEPQQQCPTYSSYLKVLYSENAFASILRDNLSVPSFSEGPVPNLCIAPMF